MLHRWNGSHSALEVVLLVGSGHADDDVCERLHCLQARSVRPVDDSHADRTLTLGVTRIIGVELVHLRIIISARKYCCAKSSRVLHLQAVRRLEGAKAKAGGLVFCARIDNHGSTIENGIDVLDDGCMTDATLRAEPAGSVLAVRHGGNADAAIATADKHRDGVGCVSNGAEDPLAESGKSDGGDIGFLTHDNSSKSQF